MGENNDDLLLRLFSTLGIILLILSIYAIAKMLGWIKEWTLVKQKEFLKWLTAKRESDDDEIVIIKKKKKKKNKKKKKRVVFVDNDSDDDDDDDDDDDNESE